MKMTKKSMAVAAVFVCLATMSGAAPVHYYWTGLGENQNWSNPDNWRDGVQPPRSGGDYSVLHFDAGSVSSNDYDTCSIRQMTFGGSGESVVRGGKISFSSGGSMIEVTNSTVTIYNDVYDDWGASFYCDKGELVLAGEVTIRSSGSHDTLVINPNYNAKPEAKVRFLGGMRSSTESRANLNLQLGYNDDPGKSYRHHLESALQLGNFTVGANYRYVELQIDAAGQDWETANVVNGIIHAGADNVLPSSLVIVPNSTYSGNTAWWDLEGHDQAIDRIAGTYRNTGVRSAAAATLTMNASGDGNFAGPLNGELSLVWNAAGAHTFDYSGVGTTTGNLSVDGGTFLISGSGSLAAVRRVSVAEGAVLSVTTDAAGALASVGNMVLDGTLSVGASVVDPLASTKVIMGANGVVNVPSGMTLTLAAVKRNGQFLDDDDYSSGWVTGGGTVRVDSSAISGLAFDWKNSASGSWAVGGNWFGESAPDGSKPVVVNAEGQSYTVTVPDGTSISPSLTVGGHEVGVATVSPSGAATIPDGSTLTLRKCGRLEVPSGASLDFAANSSVGNGDAVVNIENGGEFAVTGGTVSGDEFHGQFVVGSGGRLSVSAGTFEMTPYMSGAASYASAIKIASGGEVAISGTGVFFPHFAKYEGYPLVMDGGTLTATNNARIVVDPTRGKDLSGYLFGAGVVDLSGNSTFASDGAAAASIKMASMTADSTCLVRVRENGAFCLTNGTVSIGASMWNSPANCKTEVVFDSSAVSWFGNRLYVGYATRNGADSKVTVKSGALRIGADGLYAASVAKDLTYVENSVRATVSVEGGVLSISGGNAALGGAYYAAMMLGNSLPEGSWTSAANPPVATVSISGGVFSNNTGRVAFGTGSAIGGVVQTGGEFRSCSSAPAFLGVYDGEGSYRMSAGAAKFKETIYLGLGSSISSLPSGAWSSLSLGTHVNGNTARGILEVEGGSFETAGDIIAGTDGTYGEVSVGTNGCIRARDLKVLNDSCRLAIKVGAGCSGSVALSGELNLAEGAKIELVGASAVEHEPVKVDILAFGSCNRDISRSDIDGLPASWKVSIISGMTKRVRIVSPKAIKGTMLIYR